MHPILDHYADLIHFRSVLLYVQLSKPYSGNSMYTIVRNFATKERGSWSRTKPNLGHSRLAKSDECEAYQEEIQLQLHHLPEWVSEATSACRVTVLMVQDEREWFTDNKGEPRRIDTTNIWKPTEDAIFRHFDIDDCRAVDTRLVKVVRESGDRFSPDAPFEVMCALDLYAFEHRLKETVQKHKIGEVDAILRQSKIGESRS